MHTNPVYSPPAHVPEETGRTKQEWDERPPLPLFVFKFVRGGYGGDLGGELPPCMCGAYLLYIRGILFILVLYVRRISPVYIRRIFPVYSGYIVYFSFVSAGSIFCIFGVY